MESAQMKSNLTHSIIKTLCYSQIFSYPLTISELYKYLIHNKKVTREEVSLELYKNRNFFLEASQYVVLPGDFKLVRVRSERAVNSRKKLAKAMFTANLLGYIPSIKMIGISGSLSMYNAKKNDDIDLFFVTSKDFLWATRFLVNITLLLFGEKRGVKEKFAKDKICPNMFVAEDNLCVPKEKRSLYVAHEAVQLKVLYSKDNTYQKFIQENKWVLRYMPNVFEKILVKKNKQMKSSTLRVKAKTAIEYFFYKAQYSYMKKKITNEKVGRNYAFFHPVNQKSAIDSLFKLKVKTYIGLLEDLKKEQKYSLATAIN